jgi:hypothetical protein
MPRPWVVATGRASRSSANRTTHDRSIEMTRDDALAICPVTPQSNARRDLRTRRSDLCDIFMRTMRSCAVVALLSLEPTHAAFVGGVASARPRASPSMVIGEQATSFGPAQAIRKLKEELPQFPFLAEGGGNPSAPRKPLNHALPVWKHKFALHSRRRSLAHHL